MSRSILSPAPICEERKVFTETHQITGIIISEWWSKDGQLDRADGPARIDRDDWTGILTRAEWWKDGMKYEPTAEVRAAWLKKEAQENAARTAPASSAPVPPAPM